MKYMHCLQKCLCVVLLALIVFPFSALAAVENVLESAPVVSLPEKEISETLNTEDNKDYLPSFWNNTVKGSSSEAKHYTPWLTASEEQRAKELMSELNAGNISAADYPVENPDYGFSVGIYTLNPADFDGETFFVTLPCRELTDAELVTLISGFEALGIPFNPDSLNERNCRRFYHDGSSRDLTADETERMEELKRLVIYGVLAPEQVSPEAECQVIYSSYGPFVLYPYRKMTDNELAAFAFKKDSVWEVNPDLVQITAKQFAYSLVSFPSFLDVWNMERTLIPFTAETEGYRIAFYVYSIDELNMDMKPRDGQPANVEVWLHRNQDNTLLESRLTVEYNNDKPSIHTRRLVSEDEILAAAQSWIKDNILQAGSMDLRDWKIVKNEGIYYQVYAVSSDNSWYVYADISNTGAVNQFSLSRDPIND